MAAGLHDPVVDEGHLVSANLATHKVVDAIKVDP